MPLENIEKNPNLREKMNWHEIIPTKISDEVYSAIYHQKQFFNHMQILRITYACSILGIFSKTFYTILGE